MFHALKYTEELEKAGFTREQAEVSMKAVIEIMSENFATKADFRELGWKIDSLETRLESKIQALDSKLDSSLKELEYKLTIKLGSMMALSIGVTATVVTTLVKLLPSGIH